MFFKYLITLNECITALIDNHKFHMFQHFDIFVGLFEDYLPAIFVLTLLGIPHLSHYIFIKGPFIRHCIFIFEVQDLQVLYEAPCFIAKVL